MYTLHMDDKFVEITDFSESLDGNGNLTFNVSNNQLNLSHSSFSGLKALREAIADKEIILQIKDENDAVVWEDAEYDLQSASFSASSSGVFFSAYFTQFAPSPVENTMPTV